MSEEKTYIAIDLKSFYASVECVERHLDPLTTNLVVADRSRTEKTICLAVSPSLKSYGVSSRPRLFEVIQQVKQANGERLNAAIRSGAVQKDEQGQYRFRTASYDANALKNNLGIEIAYITAPPQMKLYEIYSTKIYSIYLKYISPEDIHVYSIDEVFIDVTHYLRTYGQTAKELAMTIIREVLYTTGITATAGIGTNLYLAKIAMDIVAKRVPANKDGVRIAELNEMTYRELLWTHQPLRDFWRVGRGISKKLEAHGMTTMGDVAEASLDPYREEQLYKLFGINAELLIDHAWGWEPTDIAAIKSYRPTTKSLSSGQVLSEPYSFEKGRIIVREMTEALVLKLMRKQLVTRQLVLSIGYDRTSLTGEGGRFYKGKITEDHYGRKVPQHAHGTAHIDHYTNAVSPIMTEVLALYDAIADPNLMMRRITIAACELIHEKNIPPEAPEQLNFFTNYVEREKIRKMRQWAEEKEKKLQKATLDLQARYGKNAVLKGISYLPGATARERNAQIGGHRA